MKNLLIFAFFIFCLVAAQVSFAQTADEVVDKYITALGGKEKMLALKTVKMTGSMNVQGADVSLVRTQKHLVGNRLDLSVMGTENYQLTTPEKSLRFFPIQNMSSPEEAGADQHASNLNSLDINGTFINYQEKGTTVESLGKESPDGIECYKLKVTYKNGKSSTYFINTKTNQLYKTSTMANVNGEDTEVSTTFSNHKQNADGYWFAYTISTPNGEINFEKIETNVPVDDAIFKAN